jgi:hypothetical protein
MLLLLVGITSKKATAGISKYVSATGGWVGGPKNCEESDITIMG